MVGDHGHTASDVVSIRKFQVSKAELGTKRICGNCAAKFYDLFKDPIVCPKCSTVFVPPKAAPVRPRRGMEPRREVVEKVAVQEEPETEGVEPVAAGDADVEVEADDKLDGAGFVVPEEADDDDDPRAVLGEAISKPEEI